MRPGCAGDGADLLLDMDLVPVIVSAKRAKVARIKRMATLLQDPGYERATS